MNEHEFARLAAQGFNRIPLIEQVHADLETPLSAYLKLAGESARAAPGAFLLESVTGGERFGRHSFIGLPPRELIEAHGNRVRVLRDGIETERRENIDPLGFVREVLARYRTPAQPGLPRFRGGLVGCIGYDAVRWIEPRLTRGRTLSDPIGCPDMVLGVCEELAVFDNLTGRLSLITHVDPRTPQALDHGRSRLAELTRRLTRPVEPPAPRSGTLGPVTHGFPEAGFLRAVGAARDYIEAGDLMQVVLAQRMSADWTPERSGADRDSALALYRALRSLNPSPYMFHFDFGALPEGGFNLVGASPEILVRLEHGRITLRPLAGTRRRGANPQEDEALERELRADAKEIAEHVMLLDLGRNDVGRVARYGSVRVTEKMAVERYSHVMHLVSNVEGELREGCDAIDALRAAFPAGTLSGAPKVRAMEIINELEPEKRGLYGGAAGWIGFDGEMDLAIAIRSAVLKDGRVHVHAGAGVVADSDPRAEWRETLAKAGALMQAALMASARSEAREEAAEGR